VGSVSTDSYQSKKEGHQLDFLEFRGDSPMSKIAGIPPVLPRVGNVSGEADAAFMAELKRTDRARYDRLIHAIQKQAYRDLKLPNQSKVGL
jgi:hypothetical protein